MLFSGEPSLSGHSVPGEEDRLAGSISPEITLAWPGEGRLTDYWEKKSDPVRVIRSGCTLCVSLPFWRTGCVSLKFFHTNLDQPFLHGPRFVHWGIVMLPQTVTSKLEAQSRCFS